MSKRRFRLLTMFVALLALGAVAVAAGGSTPAVKGLGKGKATAKLPVDLATLNASRWIVQLRGAPLATYGLGVGRYNGANNASAHLNVRSSSSAAYVSQLKSQQAAFTRQLVRTVRGAKVQRSYQVVLNGLAVKMTRKQAAIVRQMKGVKAVTPDMPYKLNMYATPAQIGAPTLWGQLGGQANAGAGVKVAVIDSGIFVRYDDQGHYTGNPCFDDSSYGAAPKGYPKGDKKFTNNKVIVARHYFRPGDPPTDGQRHADPGAGREPARHARAGHGRVQREHERHVPGRAAHDQRRRAARVPHELPGLLPSQSPDDFQNGNAYTVELVKAIEDAVKDGADVISNSWGASYQNTLAWPDPMVQASEAAVDAGVVDGLRERQRRSRRGDRQRAGDLAEGDRASARSRRRDDLPRLDHVTAPAPVPREPRERAVRQGAAFGPQTHDSGRPGGLRAGRDVSTAATNKTLGCSLAGDVSPFPAGSLTGKIALIERGICNFSEKVFNAQRGGRDRGDHLQQRRERRDDRDDGRRRPRRRRHDPVVVILRRTRRR